MASSAKNRQQIDKISSKTIPGYLVSAITLAFYGGFFICHNMLSSHTWHKTDHDQVVHIQTQPTYNIPPAEYQAMASLLINLLISISTAIESLSRQLPSEVDDDEVALEDDEVDKPSSPLHAPNTNLLTLILRGKGSTFLRDFYISIEPIKGIINLEQLLQHSNHSFACGFRMLLDELRHPNLEWIKVTQDGHWYVSHQAYFPMMIWMREEIIRQSQLEAEICSEGGLLNHRSVQFQLPNRN